MSSNGLRSLYRVANALRSNVAGGCQSVQAGAAIWQPQPRIFQAQPQRNFTVSKGGLGASASLDPSKRRLVMQAEGGRVDEYPWVWLRDNCQCSECFEKKSLQRIVNLTEFDINIKANKVENGDDIVKVHWDDGHVGEYPKQWLDYRSFRPEQRKKVQKEIKPEIKLWGGDHINNYSTADYNKIMTDDRELLRWLELIDTEGFVLVENCPAKIGPVSEMQKRIAFEKMTHYGTRYDIEVRADYPANIALTHHRIFLHTDLVYYDYMAGTAFIQCIKQHDGDGGETILADGFYAAKLLKERDPAKYKLLSETVANFVDVGRDFIEFDKVSQQPFLSHELNGEISRVTWSHFGRDSVFNVDLDKVDEIYSAMRMFDDILDDPKVHIKLKMKPGDMLTMKNTRVMHGRTELQGKQSDRHLSCGYVDEDETRSRIRVLRRKLNTA